MKPAEQRNLKAAEGKGDKYPTETAVNACLPFLQNTRTQGQHLGIHL